jgi:Flp pilus assembly protein CpaB
MSVFASTPTALLTAIAAALVVALLALLVASVGLLRLQRQQRAAAQRQQKLERDMSLLQSGAVGMGQRIMAMESSVSARSDAANSSAAAAKPYSEASHLLSLGLDKDEVASRCGLSRAEASLLDALRTQKP